MLVMSCGVKCYVNKMKAPDTTISQLQWLIYGRGFRTNSIESNRCHLIIDVTLFLSTAKEVKFVLSKRKIHVVG